MSERRKAKNWKFLKRKIGLSPEQRKAERRNRGINIQIFLGDAIRHLESHWPDRVGMNATHSFWTIDSFPDYEATKILGACRELVRYTGIKEQGDA